jgi:Lamin Tail Domain
MVTAFLVVKKVWKQICLLVVLFACVYNIDALSITEMMYDAPGTDTGSEWIEVFNDTTVDIPLTIYKLFEANSNHGISSVTGDGVLSPGEYAIIGDQGSASITSFSSYAGDVYDSSFSLNNAGESYSIKNQSGDILVQVNYTGGLAAAGDGNTLHWLNSMWESRLPNPGGAPSLATASNTNSSNQSGTNNGTSTNTTNSSTQSTTNVTNNSAASVPINPVYSMSLEMIPEQPVAGSVVKITPKVTRDYKGEKLEYTQGIIRLVTGDGRVFVQQSTKPLEITYQYPGNLRMALDYFHSTLIDKPLISIVKNIDIISPTLEIGRDGYALTVRNTSDNDIDISGFSIRSGKVVYSIAHGTVVLGNAMLYVGGGTEVLRAKDSKIALYDASGRKVSERIFEVIKPLPPVIKRVRGGSSLRASERHNDLVEGIEEIMENEVSMLGSVESNRSGISESVSQATLQKTSKAKKALPGWIGFVLLMLVIGLFILISQLASLYFAAKGYQVKQSALLPLKKEESLDDEVDQYTLVEYTHR